MFYMYIIHWEKWLWNCSDVAFYMPSKNPYLKSTEELGILFSIEYYMIYWIGMNCVEKIYLLNWEIKRSKFFRITMWST